MTLYLFSATRPQSFLMSYAPTLFLAEWVSNQNGDLVAYGDGGIIHRIAARAWVTCNRIAGPFANDAEVMASPDVPEEFKRAVRGVMV